jgi:hypothetical protein
MKYAALSVAVGLALVVIAAGFWAYGNDMDDLRADNKALTERVAFLEGREKELTADVDKAEKSNKTQGNSIADLMRENGDQSECDWGIIQTMADGFGILVGETPGNIESQLAPCSRY